MRIAVLSNAFNALTQAFFVTLKDKGHQVCTVFAISDEQILQELEGFCAEMVIAPYLKYYLSKNIYEKYPVYIVHPGPRGDRGPNALEYALLQRTRQWGVVILKADAVYDGGNIYAEHSFKVRQTSKASLYRHEVVTASLKALDMLLTNHNDNRHTAQILNPLHPKFTQKMRAIDWSKDTTQTIVDAVNLSDSFPGVLESILGVRCYLFGVWKEEKLRGGVKEILAKRNGAICMGTVDGAVWISHLKEPNRFKLPATYVLKERLQGVKEDRIPLIFDQSYATFYEIFVEQRDRIAYLHFNFHNGAMSSEQCIRLKYAVEYLKKECDILVLMGGLDFFSNGIHLNILEDSHKQGEDGWSNINAMNDLIASIIDADEVVTVASLHRNAGAGGLFLALACDIIVAQEGVVLNPHYKTLGLSGSEYHTYTLPKRVGKNLAEQILENALPISTVYAKKIGMIDKLFVQEAYEHQLYVFLNTLDYEEIVWKKQAYLEEHREYIERFKEQELKLMYLEFWDKKSAFHELRSAFVNKVCPIQTPQRLRCKEKKHA